MQKLKIAASAVLKDKLQVDREVVKLSTADFTEVSAVVIDIEDYRKGGLNKVDGTALGIPVFLYLRDEENTPEELVGHVVGVISDNLTDRRLFGRQIDEAAKRYEDKVLPPFFGALAQYVYKGKSQFDCPGHQGGAYFRRHPAGRAFYDFYGEELFRSDLCNADVAMGDLLIHEGAPLKAQKAAAKIYNADKTYFVLNGTSASNKVVLNAALTPGDLVLYDRNNHKSVNHGALLQPHRFILKPRVIRSASSAASMKNALTRSIFATSSEKSVLRKPMPSVRFALPSSSSALTTARFTTPDRSSTKSDICATTSCSTLLGSAMNNLFR